MAGFNDLKKELQDLINQAQDAVNKGDLETARKLKADIDEQKKSLEELESLSKEIDEIAPNQNEEESDVAEDKPEKPTSEDTTESESDVKDAPKQEQPKEVKEEEEKDSDDASESESDEDKSIEKVEEPTEEELEEEKKKKEKQGGKRMAKLQKNPEQDLKIQGFEEYMKSKGAKRDNVKSDDVGVTIPEEIKYIPEKEVKTVQDLSELVTKTSVSTASGKYPILKRADDKFHTVEKLEKNPELAKPKFETVAWEVATYRGAIPISQEALDDSIANLTQIVQDNIQEQKVNTLNEKIGDVLKQFNPTTVSDVDDLKAITNVQLDPGYNRRIVCTQSFYQKLDTLKDGNERYLLQDSIINTAGNTVLGMNVTVVRDDLLGKNGDAVAFVGDLERAVLFADRTDISVQWIDNDIYGKYLMGAFRFDVKQADANAGYFVTFEDDAATETP